MLIRVSILAGISLSVSLAFAGPKEDKELLDRFKDTVDECQKVLSAKGISFKPTIDPASAKKDSAVSICSNISDGIRAVCQDAKAHGKPADKKALAAMLQNLAITCKIVPDSVMKLTMIPAGRNGIVANVNFNDDPAEQMRCEFIKMKKFKFNTTCKK